MAARSFTAEAIVLRAIPYGEADLVVRLLGNGVGKVGAFARGARKSVKRFGGGVEPLSCMRVELRERPGADLYDLQAAVIVNPYLPLRSDLSRLAHAGYAAELCGELLHDRQSNDALLAVLLQFLDELCRANPRSLLLRAFELAALEAAGLSPQLTSCAGCGTPLESESPVAFDPERGGAVCAGCTRAGALRLAPDACRLLALLQEGGLDAAAGADGEGLPLEGAGRAVRAFVDRHVRHDLRSRAFMSEVGAPP